MNGFDIALTAVTACCVVLGLVKGMARLLIGTAALIAAFVLAAQFHRDLAARLTWIAAPDEARKLVAYGAIFVGTLLVGGIIGWLASKLLQAAMLGWADRLAGGAVGLVAGILVGALVILPIVAYSPYGARSLRDSRLAPYVVVVAALAKRAAPPEMSRRYDEKVEALRRYWRERRPSDLEVDRARKARRA